MVDKLVRLTSEQRANFVAYLDGELSEEESQRIEQLLAQNEVARHEVESLATVWEMLDTLPEVKATENFTEKTMATLKVDQQSTPLTEQAWFRQLQEKGGRVLGWSLVVVCGLLGFMVFRSFPPSPTDQMIRNYELLQHLDSYREIGSAEFLQRLQSSPEWQKRTRDNAEVVR